MATTHPRITLTNQWQSVSTLLSVDLSQTRILMQNNTVFGYSIAHADAAPASDVIGIVRRPNGIDAIHEEAFGPMEQGADVWIRSIDDDPAVVTFTTASTI